MTLTGSDPAFVAVGIVLIAIAVLYLLLVGQHE